MRIKILLYAIYLLVFDIYSTTFVPAGSESGTNFIIYLSFILFIVSVIWDIYTYLKKKTDKIDDSFRR